jgi:hypothetical protein
MSVATEPYPKDPSAAAGVAANEEDWEAQPKKKKQVNEPLEWIKVQLSNHPCQHSDSEVPAHVTV